MPAEIDSDRVYGRIDQFGINSFADAGLRNQIHGGPEHRTWPHDGLVESHLAIIGTQTSNTKHEQPIYKTALTERKRSSPFLGRCLSHPRTTLSLSTSCSPSTMPPKPKSPLKRAAEEPTVPEVDKRAKLGKDEPRYTTLVTHAPVDADVRLQDEDHAPTAALEVVEQGAEGGNKGMYSEHLQL